MQAAALTALPDQLLTFAAEFAETGEARAAAISVGVHPGQAPHFARHALDNPAVKTAIEQHVRKKFAQAGPMALSVLIKFAKNENDKFCSRELQLSAAKDLANRAGFNPKDMRDQASESKDMSEMSPDELRAVLQEAETILGDRAKDVANAPAVIPNAYQVIDLEG